MPAKSVSFIAPASASLKSPAASTSAAPRCVVSWTGESKHEQHPNRVPQNLDRPIHTRFGLGEDVLEPYKETLDRWLWPDPLRNQDVSVAKAKQAISSYRKAVGEPAGLAELMVYFCESAAGFSNDVGYQDEGYFNALVNMFEQAIRITRQLSAGDRDALIVRLRHFRKWCKLVFWRDSSARKRWRKPTGMIYAANF